MSNNASQPPRLSLVQAIALRQDEWEDLGINEHALRGDERQHIAAVWHWLCDMPSGSSHGARVGNEVLSDSALIVALSLPAIDFALWFDLEEWGTFDSTERTGSEAWGAGVLHRAWIACAAMGALASQRSLVAPSAWGGSK